MTKAVQTLARLAALTSCLAATAATAAMPATAAQSQLGMSSTQPPPPVEGAPWATFRSSGGMVDYQVRYDLYDGRDGVWAVRSLVDPVDGQVYHWIRGSECPALRAVIDGMAQIPSMRPFARDRYTPPLLDGTAYELSVRAEYPGAMLGHGAMTIFAWGGPLETWFENADRTLRPCLKPGLPPP